MDIFNQGINRLWCLFICFLTVCCCTCQSEGILNHILKPTVCEICGNKSGLLLQFQPEVFIWWPRATSDGLPSVEKRQEDALPVGNARVSLPLTSKLVIDVSA